MGQHQGYYSRPSKNPKRSPKDKPHLKKRWMERRDQNNKAVEYPVRYRRAQATGWTPIQIDVEFSKENKRYSARLNDLRSEGQTSDEVVQNIKNQWAAQLGHNNFTVNVRGL